MYKKLFIITLSVITLNMAQATHHDTPQYVTQGQFAAHQTNTGDNHVELNRNIIATNKRIDDLSKSVEVLKNQVNMLTTHVQNMMQVIKSNPALQAELAKKEKIATR